MGKGLCYGFNPDGKAPTTTKGSPAPKPTSSGGAGSCTASSGLKGTCISTSSCSSSGGKSEAGHCPGAANIQVCLNDQVALSIANMAKCCTYPTGSGASCTANGLAGKCISTSACRSDGGQSVAGHCNGPTDIQVRHPYQSEVQPLSRARIHTPALRL